VSGSESSGVAQFQTEYLIVLERSSARVTYDLCETEEEFVRLLSRSGEGFSTADEALLHADHRFPLRVSVVELPAKQQRSFFVRISSGRDDGKLEDYESVLRAFRKTIHQAGGHLETLWDDVSRHYAVLAYPRVHRTESLMRKLIAFFMLVTVGKEWVKETAPEKVRDALAKSKRKAYVDQLFQLDFNQLADVLFVPQALGSFEEVEQAVASATSIEDIEFAKLRGLVRRSNWERYFADIVEYDGDALKKKWLQIYDLRCVVAHNALLNREDYQRLCRLCEEVDSPLEKAIANVQHVTVPEEEKDLIAEQIVAASDADVATALAEWRRLESHLFSLAPKAVSHWKDLVSDLKKSGVFEPSELNEILDLRNFRNILVHSVGDEDIVSNIPEFRRQIGELIRGREPNLRWKDVIAEALRAHGGQAKLKDIYEYVRSSSDRELPENWQAIVRYTLQLNSRGTGAYARGGGEDMFANPARGTWSLRGYTEEKDRS
jgi:hypothetical protein